MRPNQASGYGKDIRSRALQILEDHLPSSAGSPWFNYELCQGLSEEWGFDPSPELCHWLLWKLGCKDSRLLSRHLPEMGIVREINGVKKLLRGIQRLSAWTSFNFENEPSPGDILHLGHANQGEPEHICIFISVDGDKWRTADILPCEKKGHFVADFVTRELKSGRVVGRSGVTKRLNGWANLELLEI